MDSICLNLDVLIHIASQNKAAWINLAIVDLTFRIYAYTPAGRDRFIMTFTRKITNYRLEDMGIITCDVTMILGQLHSINDQPAMVTEDETRWYHLGKIHRVGMGSNAILSEDYAVSTPRVKIWYRHGLIHRDNDLPAVCGTVAKYWFQHGLCHRDNDQPAKITANSKQWYTHGMLHREGDQPACVSEGGRRWYVNGVNHRTIGPACITNNSTHWYQYNKLHRDDGPAITYIDGSQEWHQYGKLHRDDGPAITSPNGSQAWYVRGLRHRVDGPALIEADGSQTWYQYGMRMNVHSYDPDTEYNCSQDSIHFQIRNDYGIH